MTQPITSITRGPRQSNFELLRIIAMFMVLCQHADFLPFGTPNAQSIAVAPWSEFCRIFVESAAIVGVNIFVMISGWFGIKATLKGFCNFLFQVVYFYALTLLVTWLMDLNSLSPMNLARGFAIAQNGWFVTAYMILYVVSPILNNFLNTTSKQSQIKFLIGFFTLQTVYGFIGASHDFNLGYSAISFVGLYILAGFIRRNGIHTSLKYGGIIAWLSISLAQAIIFFIEPRSIARIFGYSNPLLIVSALALVLQFNQFKIGTSKTINFIAASAFGVYLMHNNVFTIQQVWVPMMQYLNTACGWMAVAGAIVATFFVAVVLDQPRKFMWNYIATKFTR